MRGVAIIGEFYDLAACDVAVVESEADEGSHFLPALSASGTRVDGERAKTAVGDDFEDVAVTAHEDFRLHKVESRLDARGVTPWIAANVGHHHLHALGGEDLGLLESTTQVLSIGIAINCAYLWSYRRNHVDERFVADVARVPNLIAVGKMLGIPVIPVAVSVAYDSDGLHL